MTHERTQLTFWQQHALAALIAVPMLSVIRMTGNFFKMETWPDVLMHSTIIVAIALPLQTTAAYLCMRFGWRRLPLSIRAIFGCLLAAPITAILSPIISWFVGVGPEALVLASTREEVQAFINIRYPFVAAAHLTVGTAMWMVINFNWWRSHFESVRANQPELPATNPVPVGEVQNNADDTPLFMAKLPIAKQGDLVALSSELHYVRVYTEHGDDLILMRLSDAVEQANGKDGIQIHRSHWVAIDAIESVSTSSNGMKVVLSNRVELPVSRSFQGAVRNAVPNLIR